MCRGRYVHQCLLVSAIALMLTAWHTGAGAQPQQSTKIILSEDFENTDPGPYSDAQVAEDWSGIVWTGLFDRAAIVSEPGRGKALRLKYPKDGVGPTETGGQFEVGIPPADEYVLSYKVKFEAGFDFRLGGKLPGLTSGGSAFTGGRHPESGEGWSARFMWREGGSAEIYLYYVDMQAKWGEQLPLQGVLLEPGRWIELKQRIRINGPDRTDARIQAWVDGKPVMEKRDFRLRIGHRGQVDSFYFSTFHGGNTKDWGPHNDSYIRFDDFVVVAP